MQIQNRSYQKYDTTIEYYGKYTSLSIPEMISPEESTVAKNCSNKSFLELNFIQKLSGLPCLSPTGVEIGGSSDWSVSNIMLYWNNKVDSLECLTLLKIQTISKNSSNKICWTLNFFQKSQWSHVSISPRSGTRGLQRVAFLKYYNALKWENSLTGWMLPKLLIITKNTSNKIFSELNFLQKSHWAYVYISPWSETRGFVTIPVHYNISNMAIFPAT